MFKALPTSWSRSFSSWGRSSRCSLLLVGLYSSCRLSKPSCSGCRPIIPGINISRLCRTSPCSLPSSCSLASDHRDGLSLIVARYLVEKSRRESCDHCRPSGLNRIRERGVKKAHSKRLNPIFLEAQNKITGRAAVAARIAEKSAEAAELEGQAGRIEDMQPAAAPSAAA